MKKYLLLALAFSASTLSAREWYVSGNGDDTKDGSTPSAAFRSLQKAAGLVEPGDTVLIGDGIYTNTDTGEDSCVLRLDRSGTADAWITWKASPGAKPELQPVGWNGIMIAASYNITEGLTVTGANDSLVLIHALDDAAIKQKEGLKYPGNPKFNTNGIFITGRLREAGEKPHHTIVRGCTVSKCAGGGIIAIETDYVTIEDNLVFDNAWFMRYAGSGITTLENWAHDDAPGYHNIIRRNKVWNNKSLVPWQITGRLSDGNGILMDFTDLEKKGATNANNDAALADPAGSPASAKSKRPEWKGRTLIANNLCAYNGGSGIGAFRTRRVDIINNTTYHNGRIVGYAEIHSQDSEDIVMLNNIAVPTREGWVTRNLRNTNRRFDYNLYPQRATELTGSHDIMAEPRFIKVALDLREADFHLAEGSPGVDSGTDELPQESDISKVPRPIGKARDRGAYEQ